jgi:hypothetical protein
MGYEKGWLGRKLSKLDFLSGVVWHISSSVSDVGSCAADISVCLCLFTLSDLDTQSYKHVFSNLGAQKA